MNYWPSYDSIDPRSRAAYLEWLAGGRRDPNAYIGYVFLFFYGLERRALVDAQRDPRIRDEIPAIIEEVERLLGLYGQNHSFHGYAWWFVDLLKAAYGQPEATKPPVHLLPTVACPVQVRMELAKFALAGEPIPADWALTWYRTSPLTRLRTPAERCPDELAQLFRVRYGKRFGEGILVRPNKTPLRATYRPASASFGQEVSVSITSDGNFVPDISVLNGPLNRIGAVAEDCIADLDPYSRWIGKNPEMKDSIAAAALLPKDLVAEHESASLVNLTRVIEDRLDGLRQSQIPLSDLIEIWSPAYEGRLARKDGALLAQLLEKRGFGLEPDVRFGGAPPDPKKIGIVFRLPEDSPAAPSVAYSAATAALHLGVAVAAADDHISNEEIEQLEDLVSSRVPVSSNERIRLHAHLQWLLTEVPSMNGLKKRLSELPPEVRTQIAEFTVAVATADGQIDPEEVTLLGKIHKLLGIDDKELYGRLHAQTTATMQRAAGPVPVRITGPTRVEYTIPDPPPPGREPSSGVKLDLDKIERKLKQSAAVSAMLTSIFTDDDEPEPNEARIAEPEAGPHTTLLGLDAPHSGLLSQLLARTSWSRTELEDLASSSGLMPDGAMDVINDAAIDALGDVLLTGADPIEVDVTLMEELQA